MNNDSTDISRIVLTEAISSHLKGLPVSNRDELIAGYSEDWRKYHSLDQIAWFIDTANELYEGGEIDISEGRFSALIVGFIYSHAYWKLITTGRKDGWREEKNAHNGFMAMNQYGNSNHARLVEDMIRAKVKWQIPTAGNRLVEDDRTIGWFLDLNLLYATGTDSAEAYLRATAWRDEMCPIFDFEEFMRIRAKFGSDHLARGKKLFTQHDNDVKHGDHVRQVLRSAQQFKMRLEKAAQAA